MSSLIGAVRLRLSLLTSLIHKSLRIIIQATAIYAQLIISLLPSNFQRLINAFLSQLAHLIEDQITYLLLFTSDPSRMASRVVNWFSLTDPITVLRLSRKLYLQSSDAGLRARLSNTVLGHLARGFSSGSIRPHRRLLGSLERWTLRAYQENKLSQLLTAFTNSELFNSILAWIQTQSFKASGFGPTISFVRSTLFVAQHFAPQHSNLCVTLQLLLDRLNSPNPPTQTINNNINTNHNNNNIVIVENQSIN